jgi:predicted kinase
MTSDPISPQPPGRPGRPACPEPVGSAGAIPRGRALAEALEADPAWAGHPAGERDELIQAALLHEMGPRAARLTLWEERHPFGARERAVGLVANLHRPFRLPSLDEAGVERALLRMSLECRLDHLALLAGALVRARGGEREAEDAAALELFGEEARRLGVWERPYPFPDGLSRHRYFARGAYRDLAWHDDTLFELVLLTGPPGAGKSTHRLLRFGELPAVSFDEIRAERGVRQADPQEEVVAEGMHRLREHFRARRSVVFDTTALSRRRRARPAALARQYGGRVRIVHVEVGPERLLEQNRDREAVVPEEAIARMMRSWEVPQPHEAERVEHYVNGRWVPQPIT